MDQLEVLDDGRVVLVLLDRVEVTGRGMSTHEVKLAAWRRLGLVLSTEMWDALLKLIRRLPIDSDT